MDNPAGREPRCLRRLVIRADVEFREATKKERPQPLFFCCRYAVPSAARKESM